MQRKTQTMLAGNPRVDGLSHGWSTTRGDFEVDLP
jgi:hypothetical protein